MTDTVSAVDFPADADTAVDVVVVAYGPPPSLAAALGALQGAFSVVVVDNASSPDTATVAARAGARYVDSGANLGFTAAVNAALDVLRGRTGDVLLLNPDARIGPDAVRRLHELLHEDARLACAGPALVEPETGRPARSRWPWHTPLGAWLEAAGLARWRLDTARFFLGGAVLLVRREALEDVGSFDERFFLYGEDEDWQRRARQRGWRARYCPDVVAEHGGGGTEDDHRRLLLRLHAATERYVRKWYGPSGWSCYRAGCVAGFALRALVGRGRRRRAACLARLYLVGPDAAARRAGVFPHEGPGGPA